MKQTIIAIICFLCLSSSYIQAQKILRKRSNFKWKLTSVTDCAKISKNVYAMR